MENKPIRIHFAGGGTAGHLFPAVAIANEFSHRFPNCEIRFWGTKRGVEFKLKDQLKYPLNLIQIRGFNRKMSLQNLLIPFEFIGSVFKLLFSFIWKRPDLVVGTGGYISLPVVFSAATVRIPTAIHEQNSYPGVSTRVLGKWAKRIYLTYDSSVEYFKHQNRVEVFGNPVRQFDAPTEPELAMEQFNIDNGKKTLFVFGGSQGALGINRLMLNVAPRLVTECKIQIIWVTGPNHYNQIVESVGMYSDIKLHPFITDIYSVFAICDLCVCRAGATTIAELTYLEVPAIMIPFPSATGGHQEYNARDLESKGAAICILEKDLDAEKLFQTIKQTIENEAKLVSMKTNMKSLARPNAAHDIVSDLCDHLILN